MKKKVVMKDIAEAMGGSIVTVSKALAGKEGVSERVRGEIIRKAEELGYVIGEKKKGEPYERWKMREISSRKESVKATAPPPEREKKRKKNQESSSIPLA